MLPGSVLGATPREFESRILRLAEQALSRVALTRAALDVFVATDTPSKAQPTWYAGPPHPGRARPQQPPGPAPKPAPITIVTATDFADVRDRPGRRITLPAEQNDHWRRIRRTMLLTRT